MIIFEVIVKVSFVILGSILHNSGLNVTKKTSFMCEIDFEIRKVNHSGDLNKKCALCAQYSNSPNLSDHLMVHYSGHGLNNELKVCYSGHRLHD